MFFRVSHGFSIAISSLFDLTEYFISLLIKEGSRLGSEGLTSCLPGSFLRCPVVVLYSALPGGHLC